MSFQKDFATVSMDISKEIHSWGSNCDSCFLWWENKEVPAVAIQYFPTRAYLMSERACETRSRKQVSPWLHDSLQLLITRKHRGQLGSSSWCVDNKHGKLVPIVSLPSFSLDGGIYVIKPRLEKDFWARDLYGICWSKGNWKTSLSKI